MIQSIHLPSRIRQTAKRFRLARLATLGFALMCYAASAVAQTPALSPSARATSSANTPLAQSPDETIPPVPKHFFTDEAKVSSPCFAIDLDRRLEGFERDTTNQFIVAVFPKMQSSADLAAYCTRIFKAWGVGQRGVNNGVVLFVFVQDRKVRLSVGSGLEKVLSDQAAQKIIDATIPFFRKGDYEGAIGSAVDGVINLLQADAPRPSSLSPESTP